MKDPNYEKALSEAEAMHDEFTCRTEDGFTTGPDGRVYDSNGRLIGIPVTEYFKNHPIDEEE